MVVSWLSSRSMTNYRPDIDGLRAIAVISVVAFHTFPKAVPGGFTGVDVFFVISGFLISRIILDGIETEAFSLRRFYERRIKRIFPALSCVLLASLLVGWIALFPDEYQQLGKHVLAAAGFASNIELWRESGYFDVVAARKPLLHLWSLGVEEQFYLFWPCCLLFIHRKRWTTQALAALVLISFIANVFLASENRSAVFYLPFARLWELLLGYAALKFTRLGYSEHRTSAASLCAAVGAVLVAGSAFWIRGATEYPGWRGLFPTLGTGMLIVAGRNAWINRRVLSSPPFVMVGLISYPLYLWHWPLLSFAKILTRPTPEANLALVAVSFVLAWLTWRYIEVPIRHSRNSHAAPQLVGALVTISFCGAFVFATRGADFRPGYKNSLAAIQDVNSGFQGIECEVRHADLNLCRQSKPGPVDAVVLGDSHAQTIFAGLALDPNRNWLLLGNLLCPPVLGVIAEDTDGINCTDKLARLHEYLLDPSSAPIVVLAFYGYYADMPSRYRIESSPPQSKQQAFGIGLSNMIKVALEQRKSVYLVIDVPELPFSPRDCIREAAFGWASGRADCVVSRKVIDVRQAGLRSVVSGLIQKWPRVQIFDPLPVVCGVGDCTPVQNNFSYYFDSHHLSLKGSQIVGRSFLEFLNEKEGRTSLHETSHRE
jgi:peptidoglycan/LPS O-acetylase OafA/YrhL